MSCHRKVRLALVALSLLGGLTGCGKNPTKERTASSRRSGQDAGRKGKPAPSGTTRPVLEIEKPSAITLSGPQDLHPSSFTVGQVGRLANDGEPYSFRINHIIDGTSMIVTLGRFANFRFVMKGFSTAGKAEGEYVSFREMVKVSRTAKYGRSTLDVLEPLSPEDNVELDRLKTAKADTVRQAEQRKREEAEAKAKLAARLAAEREVKEKAAQEEAKQMAIKAIPRLVAELSDEQARADAILTLGKVGEPAVPALLKALDDPDREARRAAAMVLGHIGPVAKSALPALQKMANNDSEDRVREVAAKAVERITRKK